MNLFSLSQLLKTARQKKQVFAWSIYGFAETVFSMNVITFYFALWVVIDKQGKDIYYSIALSASMILAGIFAPILGTLSDRIGKKMPFFIWLVSINAVCVFFISFAPNLLTGLILFAFANLAYQLADVLYNSLLPQISSNNEKIGKMSGIGISLGYFGAIFGLLVTGPFVKHFGRQITFMPTAIMYLLCALPCMFFIKDIAIKKVKENHFFAAIKKVKTTIVNIEKYPSLGRFLIAMFITLNAVNTIIIFMSIYVKKVIHFSDTSMVLYYMVCSAFAIVGSFIAGLITDKLGAKKTLIYVLLLWCLALFAAVFATGQWIFWLIGPAVGISLGATWTCGRVLVVDLSPPEMLGEIFGFYAMVGKTSAIFGPMIWGLCIWGLEPLGEIRYRIATGILLMFIVFGIIILRKVQAKETKAS